MMIDADFHGGTPKMNDLFHGKSQLEMDENWWYPYFRKPPYRSAILGSVKIFHVQIGDCLEIYNVSRF